MSDTLISWLCFSIKVAYVGGTEEGFKRLRENIFLASSSFVCRCTVNTNIIDKKNNGRVSVLFLTSYETNFFPYGCLKALRDQGKTIF